MTDPIAAHLAAVRRDRYSDATLTARARILATLPDPLGMDRLATLAWWESRQTRPDGEPRAAASLSGEKAHAAEFWRWAMREGLPERNPAVASFARLNFPAVDSDLDLIAEAVAR